MLTQDNETPVKNHRLPEYSTPPVLEVVAGVQFSPLAKLQTRHLGGFCERARKDFPITRDMPPLFDVPETPSIEFLALPPLRRVFILSEDQNYVMQLQDTRFNFNWKRVKPDDPYPRFGTVFAKFQENWGAFSDYVDFENLGPIIPNRYELTYVNHIELKGQNLSRELQAKVKMFNWDRVDPGFLPAPNSASGVWLFQMPDSKGTLGANLSHAKRPDGRDLLVLNMSCSGPASSQYTMKDWFNTAHEWIVRGFTDLTTSEAHKEWGRIS
jgi:uncharacterized protein (TIGR04255 family)